MSGGDTHAASVWAFHRGALGDSVLLWPRLREWVRRGSRVVLVTDAAKGRLAQREVGVEAQDAERARFNRLWIEGADVEPEAGVAFVVDHVSGGHAAFGANLRRMFPGAQVRVGQPPRGGAEAARWESEHPLSRAPLRANEHGPIVLHVGAGSRQKRWPLARWQDLATAQREGRQTVVLAGEVERDQFAPAERDAFNAMGGRYIDDLTELAGAIRGARLFIGCDSGPAHLAAQLGVRTLVLFGPTDPLHWAPVGPGVRVLAPESPREMDWLTAAGVSAAVADGP